MNELLRARLSGVIQSQLGVDADAITDEATFKDDLGADNLDMVELIMRLEDEFGIVIDDESEMPSTVADACRIVEAKTAGLATA